MTQKFPHLDSCITPHCDGRAGECGLWSQTDKPKSETCHLLMAFSVSASLPVGIRIVFPCGGILRIQRKALARTFAQGKYSASGSGYCSMTLFPSPSRYSGFCMIKEDFRRIVNMLDGFSLPPTCCSGTLGQAGGWSSCQVR